MADEEALYPGSPSGPISGVRDDELKAYFGLDFLRVCDDEGGGWPRAGDRDDDEPFDEPFRSADELLSDIDGSGDSRDRFLVRAARPSARLLLIHSVYLSVKLRAQ